MDPNEDECYTRLKRFTSNTPQQDLVNLYSKWAATYEKVMTGTFFKIYKKSILMVTHKAKLA